MSTESSADMERQLEQLAEVMFASKADIERLRHDLEEFGAGTITITATPAAVTACAASADLYMWRDRLKF